MLAAAASRPSGGMDAQLCCLGAAVRINSDTIDVAGVDLDPEWILARISLAWLTTTERMLRKSVAKPFFSSVEELLSATITTTAICICNPQRRVGLACLHCYSLPRQFPLAICSDCGQVIYHPSLRPEPVASAVRDIDLRNSSYVLHQPSSRVQRKGALRSYSGLGFSDAQPSAQLIIPAIEIALSNY